MRKKKQNIVDKREKTKEYQVGFKMLPTFKTLQKPVWKTEKCLWSTLSECLEGSLYSPERE
jgi:hypothetical protein